MSVKVQFVISDEAMDVINAAATERKRGEWLSSVVVEYSRIVTGLPAQSVDDGLLERIDGRLANVERQLAVLIQKAG
ncbi:MAG: hypothetical protein E6Q97_30675 [Desulfurellales bacterium]|nr:MAG: hypothetical protein E6Q97_30675 [Desulfurellales bacterium]